MQMRLAPVRAMALLLLLWARASGAAEVAILKSTDSPAWKPTVDALRRVAPSVSLYVNGYNTAARRVYARCGFRSAGTFATVLF